MFFFLLLKCFHTSYKKQQSFTMLFSYCVNLLSILCFSLIETIKYTPNQTVVQKQPPGLILTLRPSLGLAQVWSCYVLWQAGRTETNTEFNFLTAQEEFTLHLSVPQSESSLLLHYLFILAFPLSNFSKPDVVTFCGWAGSVGLALSSLASLIQDLVQTVNQD